MTQEINERLKDSADACIKAHAEWIKDKKNSASREALQEAVHELRKTASRLEIDMAVSDRDDGARKQIPIPAHRDARGRHQNADDNDSAGNNASNDADSGKPKPRRRPQRKSASGGGNQD